MPVTVQTLLEKTYGEFGVPPPPVPELPYRYAFNLLEFGANTRFIVERVKGLLGWSGSSSSVRSDSTHGSVPGLLTLDPKTIEFTIKADCQQGTDVQTCIDMLKEAFRIPLRSLNPWVGDFNNRGYFTDRATELRYMRPGWEEPRITYCRVNKFDLDSDYALATGLIDCEIQLVADDPLSYGYNTYIVSVPAGEEYEWDQKGDFPDGYAPYCVLSGNLVNPSIVRRFYSFYALGGKTLKVAFDLSTTDGMQVDMKSRLVSPMGANSAMTENTFWAVQPTGKDYHSNQFLAFNNDSPSASCDFYLRAVWM